jgi:hypothetical protein
VDTIQNRHIRVVNLSRSLKAMKSIIIQIDIKQNPSIARAVNIVSVISSDIGKSISIFSRTSDYLSNFAVSKISV